MSKFPERTSRVHEAVWKRGPMKTEGRDWDQKFDLSAGILCLDFANTVLKRNQPWRTQDELASYSRLVAFAKQAGALSPTKANRLRAQSERAPSTATRVLTSAIVLREAIYRIFLSLTAATPAAPRDLKLLDQFAIEAWRHRRLVPTTQGDYRWEWRAEAADSLEQILWPISLSAAELLTSERVRAVRACAADDCAWLFLDESRNRSRRWCDMKVCGNRQKARLHYHRTQQ
jgi:predicted RNA-binding Zn ribbon-like protein